MNETTSSGINPISMVYLTAVSLTNVSGLTLNVFLLVVFIKSKSLHTLDNCFIINLTVTDILVGIDILGYAVFLILPFEDKALHGKLCFRMHILTSYLYAVQFYALLWLTLDRFLKVVYPFTHNRMCIKRNVILIIVGGHAVSALQMIPTVETFQWDGQQYCLYYYFMPTTILFFFCLYMLCAMKILLCLNMKILLIARRQRREIVAKARPVVSAETQTNNARNISRVLGILTLFTFVTYVPSWFYAGLLLADVKASDSVMDAFAYGTLVLWNSNALVAALAFLLGRKNVKLCPMKLLKFRRNEIDNI